MFYQKKKKEYLKYKSISERLLFPHQQIYDKFISLLQLFQSFNELSIDIILSEMAQHPKTHALTPLVLTEERDHLKYFCQIHSSIALIHYFNKKYDETNETPSVDEYGNVTTNNNKKEKEKEQIKEKKRKKKKKKQNMI